MIMYVDKFYECWLSEALEIFKKNFIFCVWQLTTWAYEWEGLRI